jgi:OOP family OmpA-OmpF porin
VSGTFASEADSADFEEAVSLIDGAVITIDLVERPVADAGVAVVVETDLNQLVSDDPILFDPSSTTISDESVATIDRVAAVAKRVGGITIVVEGHTDTDGRADSNQALSEGRARSVREALIVRGIAADTLTIVGFGGTEPILDADGVENKAASRRVEFVVSAT